MIVDGSQADHIGHRLKLHSALPLVQNSGMTTFQPGFSAHQIFKKEASRPPSSTFIYMVFLWATVVELLMHKVRLTRLLVGFAYLEMNLFWVWLQEWPD